MHYPIIIILKILAIFLWLLPRSPFLFLGRVTGFFLFLIGFRTKIARENLERAFPEKTKEEKQGILRANYLHYGIVLLEFIRSFWRYGDFVKEQCVVEGESNLRAALEKGKGVLVFTAHIGNWELLPAAGASLLHVPSTMVTKHLKPEWLHDFIVSERESVGVKMAFEPRTMQTVLRALGKKEIVGFVMDQYMGAPFAARVPFFGIPVGSQIALATIAGRMEAPVVPASVYRRADGRYVVSFEAEMPLSKSSDREQAVLENTANYVKKTEEWVRERPEQWLWIHRRWKGNLSPLAPNSVGEFVK